MNICEKISEYQNLFLSKLYLYSSVHMDNQLAHLICKDFDVDVAKIKNQDKFEEIKNKYKVELKHKLTEVIDISLIKKALDVATECHKGQFRNTGEPFIAHPIEVAKKAMDHKFETNIIVASLLHDTVEDTSLTYSTIEMEFGSRVSEMVYRLTRIRDGVKISAQRIIEEAISHNDDDVLIIKLLDRMHNIETINGMSTKKKIETFEETFKHFWSLFVKYDMLFELSEIEHLYKLHESEIYQKNQQEMIEKAIDEPSALLDIVIKIQNVSLNSKKRRS